ncbi:MAG: hypothetical protein KKC01_11915 [Gammaproteobacteria bacterium]|nr:hypothetical protein [Gammaproteobacteria bacterium]
MNALLVRLPPVVLMLLACTAGVLQAQTLSTWTAGPGRLGLGYPVPIPVDTPLPFDGFRSYQGLLTRHFDLSNQHGFIQRQTIGVTEQAQRNIYMYIISDPDDRTADLREEGSVLINGGIHAREWQSPEVVTGIMELLSAAADDAHLHQYLIENMNVALIPVLNVDGFLQTQRTPDRNYLDSDPDFPLGSPRDGRMRRKNMRATDEQLASVGDHLNGIDLNRNSAPFHANSSSSSGNPDSLVYHGQTAFSETETQALINAPDFLLPGAVSTTLGDRLRMFIDVHSFTRVLFPVATFNTARNQNQARLMRVLVDHHKELPGNKVYRILSNSGPGFGIGTTSEYFANQFQVPSWTLELEPGNGGGTEYGGFGSNGHDGFMLPETEIRRVRENMAASIAAAAYWTAGPPSVQSLSLVDVASGQLIYNARLLPTANDAERQLISTTPGALVAGHSYAVRLGFDKPMRWLDGEEQVIALPGQPAATQDLQLQLKIADSSTAGQLELSASAATWATQRGFFGTGYARYKTDSLSFVLDVADSARNQQLLNANDALHMQFAVTDMTGHALDRNALSAVDWNNGDWRNHESDSASLAGIVIPAGANASDEGFAVTGRMAGTWRSLNNSGVGFIIEPLADERVVVAWASYDEAGGQRWLVGVGEQLGNRIIVDNMLLAEGASFQQFDPDDVQRTPFAGSLEFTFTDCDNGVLQFHGFGQTGVRTDLINSSRVAGSGCDEQTTSLPALAHASGSWHDASRRGEGMNMHVLPDGRAVLFWYSNNNQGEQIWFTGVGTVAEDSDRIDFDRLVQTRGGRFGNLFDPADVERVEVGQASFTPLCNDASFDFSFADPELGSGSLNLVRLTRITGIPDCP